MVALALDAANLSLAFRGHNNNDDDEADAGSKQRLGKGEVVRCVTSVPRHAR